MDAPQQPAEETFPRLRLGISACLLGHNVRFDGGHKKDTFLTKTLGPFVDWVAVCPEVGAGLGVPRPTLRLVGGSDDDESGNGGGPRLVQPKTGIDHTDAMLRFSRKEITRLSKLELSGFVLKSQSPSCGMERVKVYNGVMAKKGGRGIFAGALLDAFPLLPVEEEGRLNDALLRETFFEQVFAYKRWQSFCAQGVSRKGLIQFHAAHKYLLLSHSPEHYRELGHVVADMKGKAIEAVCEAYAQLLMQGLKRRATLRKHTNVLQHMLGFFKRDLDREARAEILGVIQDFRAGLVPLVVPITLIRHHVRTLQVEYLAEQVYLEPTPKELVLRTHL